MSLLNVNLGEASYIIVIEAGALSSIGERSRDLGLTGRAAIITNPVVNPLYGDAVRESLDSRGISHVTIEIPDGEEFKNSDTLNSVYDRLIDAGIDRKSFIVALGGGVVGDLAGYAAATYLRGIPFVQVPTTLLAQVDSSVGGKTAIDHKRGKNLIGAFYQPRLVLIDVQSLATLPEREFCAGLGEVIKYGVSLDLRFFEFLESNRESIKARNHECLETIIHRSCELKAGIVEQDEKESGLRAVLNYGHTLGHAFETLSGYRDLIHGEAVACGMLLAARVSEVQGFCSVKDVERIATLLSVFGLPVHPPTFRRQDLLDALLKDKKSHGGTIGFVCNDGIGRFRFSTLLPEQLLTLSGLEV